MEFLVYYTEIRIRKTLLFFSLCHEICFSCSQGIEQISPFSLDSYVLTRYCKSFGLISPVVYLVQENLFSSLLKTSVEIFVNLKTLKQILRL